MNIKNKYKVLPVDYRECKDWFLRKHYAKRIPNCTYCFGLYSEDADSLFGNLVIHGVISFGISANNNLNEIVQGCDTLELNRLIVDEGLEKNSLSFFVSTALSLLPKPMLVVSYADPGNGHHGYIYQATNWIYTGVGSAHNEFIKDGKKYHQKTMFDRYGTSSVQNAIERGYTPILSVGKHRYLMLLCKKRDRNKFLAAIPWAKQPYPKGDNKNYDSSYQPPKQNRLNI